MNEKQKLQEKELEKVTSGAPDNIEVKIKTLDGENDEYQIALSDSKVVRP